MKDFYIDKRIYYHDTDCGGVVYYANYLKHLEEARTEYFLSKGINLKELANQGIYFVVRQVVIDYKSPAKYNDIIRITAKISKLKTSAMQFFQNIKRNNTVLIEATTMLVCVDKKFKPMRIPDKIKKEIIL